MKTIVLGGEKELRIFSLPLRQKILRQMQMMGRPVTAKQIADSLNITPSSAQHHMKKLASIGLVEPDHTELIKGIRANFMRLAKVTVSIGQQYDDALSSSRDAFMREHLRDAFSSYMRVVANGRSKPEPHTGISRLCDLYSEIVHLTDEQADELHSIILDYLNSHTEASEGTRPWEMVFLAYPMDLAGEREESRQPR